MNTDFLVDASWLQENLGTPGIRIIDCDTPQAYRRGHIPGAVGLSVHPWLKGGEEYVSLPAGSVFTEVPTDPHVMSRDEFEKLASQLGIADDTMVIAYDSLNMAFAARFWWVLRHYGHRNARVLDGGWGAWLQSGGEVSIVPSQVEETTFRASEALPPTICRIDELLTSYDKPDVQVVNVLPPPLFSGQANPFGNRRVGHIPGSVNVPFAKFLDDDGTLRQPNEIQGLLESAGLSPDRETIVHCQGGIATTLGVFALSMLGWEKVRAYDAAMAEWANREDTPLVTSG